MSNRGAQQQISTERLPSLLREVYEGRLLLPVTAQNSWDDERRLRLFESIYRGLPIGSLTVWRTTTHLEHLRTIGDVPIQERPGSTSSEQLRMYLADGMGRVSTLFEELGTSFWNGDKSSLRRPLVPGRGSFLVFELETRTFRVRQKRGTPLRETEIALTGLLDAETQHASSFRLRALPGGERLANRLAHLVDAFFDFSLPVITVASDEVGPLLLLPSLDSREPVSLPQGPKTTWWYCDTCGQPIEHPSDGVMEVLHKEGGERPVTRGLQLVHARKASPRQSGCQYDQQHEFERDGSRIGSLELTKLLGLDGLATLFSFLSFGSLPKEQLIELGRRLHIPGYERARFHIEDAIQQGVLRPKQGTHIYSQEEIAATLEWADRTGRKP